MSSTFLGRVVFITAISIAALGILYNLLLTTSAGKHVLLAFDAYLDDLQGGLEYNKNNRYLLGNFYPVSDEVQDIPLQVISGSIPKDLEGVFLRVGPNPVPAHTFRKLYHWFDGHGMVHSLRIRGQQATYSNAWVKTERLALDNLYGRVISPYVGEMRGLIGLLKILVLFPFKAKVFELSPLSGQANTAINVYDNKVYLGHEGSFPFEIRVDNDGHVSSVGHTSFNDALNYPVTAHPKIINGHLYFNGYSAVPNDKPLKYGVYCGASQQVTDYFTVDLPVTPFAHDFAVTSKHALLIESSIQFGTEQIMEGVFFNFQEKHKLRVGVLPLHNASASEIQWFEADKPYGSVHTLNAWEDGDDIFLYAPLSEAFDGALAKLSPFHMSQIHFRRSTGTMNVTVINADYIAEFPRLHPKYTGIESEFGYAGIQEEGVASFTGVLKFNLLTKVLVGVIKYGAGLLGGEPVTIPKPGAAGEASDGVYLATFIHNEQLDQAEWHLYDGTTMAPEAVVRLLVPNRRVPYGFHGEWISEEVLQGHIRSV